MKQKTNVKVFNERINKNEAETIVKRTSCDWNCKLNKKVIQINAGTVEVDICNVSACMGLDVTICLWLCILHNGM